MMVMEPMAILFKRAIVRNGDIGASGCHPRQQQPQVMTQLAGERRCRIVVRPMRQCQVMLRIEKIDFFHLYAKIAIFGLTSVKNLDTFIQKHTIIDDYGKSSCPKQ
jgi:hypothetical protein